MGGGRKSAGSSNIDGANANATSADESNGAAAASVAVAAAAAASEVSLHSAAAGAAAAAAAAAIASSLGAASADTAAAASAVAADALGEARAASPRKGSSPISPALLDLSAVFKPSQSLASRRKVGRRRHKSGKKGGSAKPSTSAKGDGAHHSPIKKGSDRRMRGSQAGPGKEGRLSRRNKRKQQQQQSIGNKDGVGAEQQQVESSTASSLPQKGGASAAASESVTATAATGEHDHAADIFVTKTAGGEAVEAAFLPPPIGLDRNRTYSHSDHDTLLTGSGTLTTAVSTTRGQATIEGMSHQDTLEHFDVQTNQSSEIASLGGGSIGHAGYGRVGFAQLEELPSVVAGAGDGTDAIVADGKTPTLSIHTFPCTRGRSLEAPAPFDERGADAMTRYRQHDEDEYLTDESSEVPVVPLHWPKARRPGEERDFEGLAVVSADADADFFDDDDDDDELQVKIEALHMNDDDSDIDDEQQEEDEQDDVPPTQDAKQEETSTKRRLQHQQEEEEEEEGVTGEEIEVEVQESIIGITATAPAASSTSNEKVVVEELSMPATADMEPARPTSPLATAVETTKTTTQAAMSNTPEERPPRSASTEPHRASSSAVSDTFCRASSVTLPTGTSIGCAVAGKKTPTDHAFSSAVMTPERERLDTSISELDRVTTAVVIGEPEDDDDLASNRSCNSTVEVLKGDDDVEEEERVEGEEKKEETSSVIAKVPSNDDSESTPSGLVPFSPPLPTRASSFPNLQTARTASFSALPNLPNPIPFVRQAESFGARSNMSIGSNSSSAWKSWPTPVGTTITAVQSSPVEVPSSVHTGHDGNKERGRDDKLPLFPAGSNSEVCEKGDQDEDSVGDSSRRANESCKNNDEDSDGGAIEETVRTLRASPDGSASTVRIRTFDASKPTNVVEEVVAIEPKSSDGEDEDEDVPSIPAVSSISFPTNRYLNPKLDDGKLYSEHPHDEAPSPLQSPKDDIFRPSGGRKGDEDEGDENGRSEFPKIAHSSSSGSHSLPAVLSPAYKFEPIENDYYFESESESESCSGEDESNYESSPDGLKQSNVNSEEGNDDQEGSGDQKPRPIGEKDRSNDGKDTSNDVQSSRYESFARSGVNLMRNLTQNDDSTVSIVAEAAAAATAAVSGRQQQQPSERSSSRGGNNKKNDEFTFSLSDIPSMLSRCIGDIGIGEYYDASASAFQPEKEMEKKQ